MRHAPRPAAYQPHLEFLEARLPPGDVLLGATLGALLTGPTLSQESFVSAGDVRPLRRTLSGIDVLPSITFRPVADGDELSRRGPWANADSALTRDTRRSAEPVLVPAVPADRRIDEDLLAVFATDRPHRPAGPGLEAGEHYPAFFAEAPGRIPAPMTPPVSLSTLALPRELSVTAPATGLMRLPFAPIPPTDAGRGDERVLPGESPYLYGVHDLPGNLGTLDSLLNRRGWVLLMKYLQGGPAPFDPLIPQVTNAGYGVIVRLHWDTGDGEGTVPVQALYPTFAANAKLTVQNNPAAKYWILGNETNLCTEWPRGTGFACHGTRRTTQITPQSYAQVYVQTYDRIHELDGTVPNLHVIPAPTGVWAGDLPQLGATDFLCDFARMLELIPHSKIDALAFHPKTHGHDPARITSLVQSPPDFDCGHNQRVYWEFPVYRDLMRRVPADLRDRKVFFTELNPHDGTGWSNVNNGYLLEAFEEVNRWNRGQIAGWTGQRVTGMIVYRWEGGEPQWRIDNKPNVQADLRSTVARGYRWDQPAWSAWTRITTSGTTAAAPAVTAFGDQLVALHRGDDGQIYASRSADGTTWTSWRLTAPSATDTAPALLNYGGALFAFATGTDGYVYTSVSYDGDAWSDWFVTTDQYLGTSRAVAVTDYFGYLIAVARGDDRHIYLMGSGDGFTWSGWSELPQYNGLTDQAPMVTVFGDNLFFVVVGVNGDVFYNSYDPNTVTWSGWTLAYAGVQADRAVAAAVYYDKLYLLRKDPGATTLSYAWTVNGTTWNAWQATGNGGGTDQAPALAPLGNRLYGVRRDVADRGVYVSYFAE